MISLKNVYYTYAGGETETLKGVDLELKEGECLLLTGESGCGKSTITKMINGLIPHFYEGTLEGEIKIDGHPSSQLSMHIQTQS